MKRKERKTLKVVWLEQILKIYQSETNDVVILFGNGKEPIAARIWIYLCGIFIMILAVLMIIFLIMSKPPILLAYLFGLLFLGIGLLILTLYGTKNKIYKKRVAEMGFAIEKGFFQPWASLEYLEYKNYLFKKAFVKSVLKKGDVKYNKQKCKQISMLLRRKASDSQNNIIITGGVAYTLFLSVWAALINFFSVNKFFGIITLVGFCVWLPLFLYRKEKESQLENKKKKYERLAIVIDEIRFDL